MDNDESPSTNPEHEISIGTSLASGSTASTHFQRPANRGETLYFMADSKKLVDEVNENNNVTSSTPLSDLMLPNLYITSVSPDPERPAEGEEVEWTVTVRNDGPGNSPEFNMAMDDDEDPDNPVSSFNMGPPLELSLIHI